MKAHDVIYVTLFSAMTLSTATVYAQEQEAEPVPQVSSMIGKKYTVAEDLGMFHFFSAIVSSSHLIESFSTSGAQFDAKHIHVFLVESKGGLEERTIIDELIFDRNTDDSFSYVPIYDRRSNSKKEYFARYSIGNTGEIVLKEIYEFEPDTKKIIAKPPIPGMVVQLDEL
ncbi:MAG: hypothetical protein LBB84_03750 [Tannerellaceae bacterium]|jgi:hypothetical protein|nr:hypothetical protein [Tannerellaceae bacterium]